MTGKSGQMRQTTTAEVCLDTAQATRPTHRSRQMACWNVVVHVVRPVSLAEDALQNDPSLTITGKAGLEVENVAEE
jgi:hypothetical protein